MLKSKPTTSNSSATLADKSDKKVECNLEEVPKMGKGKRRETNVTPKKQKLDPAINNVCESESPEMSNEEANLLKAEIERLKKRNAEIEVAFQKCKEDLEKVKSKQVRPMKTTPTAAARGLKLKVENEVKKILSKCFSPGQIDRLLEGNEQEEKWNSEDIARAITLRSSISIKSYEYLQKCNIPLPSLSTLQNWVKEFKCGPGVLEDVLCLLKACSVTAMTPLQKFVVLCFNEMTITEDSGASTDGSRRTYTLQAVLARGLCSRWKQLIFYDFDALMTSELLQDLIVRVEACGLEVVAVTSEMEDKNSQVWKDLDISTAKTYMVNPAAAERKVWVFYDAPHLLTLLRSHFIDEGITLADGTKVNRQLIEEVLRKTKGHPVSEYHLNMDGQDRRDLRTATRLFSGDISRSLMFNMRKAVESRFFSQVKDAFDVLNSLVGLDKMVPHHCAFGVCFKYQKGILDNFLEVCSAMRFGERKSMAPIQEGFIVTINSLFGLFEDVKAKNVKYFLTCRLNNECLDRNLFSKIRGPCAYGPWSYNPPPDEACDMVRNLVLSGCIKDIKFPPCDGGDAPLSAYGIEEDNCSDMTGPESEVEDEDEDGEVSYVTSELCQNILGKSQCDSRNKDKFETEIVNDYQSVATDPDYESDVGCLTGELLKGLVDDSATDSSDDESEWSDDLERELFKDVDKSMRPTKAELELLYEKCKVLDQKTLQYIDIPKD